MPISREPQVSDLAFCDRETANLGLTQQSPRRPPRHTTPDNNTPDHSLPLRLIRTTRCEGLTNEYKRRLTSHDTISGTHVCPEGK